MSARKHKRYFYPPRQIRRERDKIEEYLKQLVFSFLQFSKDNFIDRETLSQTKINEIELKVVEKFSGLERQWINFSKKRQYIHHKINPQAFSENVRRNVTGLTGMKVEKKPCPECLADPTYGKCGTCEGALYVQSNKIITLDQLTQFQDEKPIQESIPDLDKGKD